MPPPPHVVGDAAGAELEVGRLDLHRAVAAAVAVDSQRVECVDRRQFEEERVWFETLLEHVPVGERLRRVESDHCGAPPHGAGGRLNEYLPAR